MTTPSPDPEHMSIYDWLLASGYGHDVVITEERDIRAVHALDALLSTGFLPSDFRDEYSGHFDESSADFEPGDREEAPRGSRDTDR